MNVLDAHGAEVSLVGGRLILEEARDYSVMVDGDAVVCLGARQLERAGRTVSLSVGHMVGETVLSIESGGLRQEIPVDICPRAAKLSSASWVAMLSELERWLPGVSVGVEAARHGSVETKGTDRVPPELLAEALLPLLPDLHRAVSVVLARPREKLRRQEELLPLRRLRRIGATTLRHLQRHPRDAAWLKPPLPSGPEPLLPHSALISSVDHPANRYLSWLLLRVEAVLRRTAARLEALSGKTSKLNETQAWCLARAARLEDAADGLHRQHRRSFLRHLTPAPPTEAALLVIQDEPAYARVHALGRRFLSPRFQLDADANRPPSRPSYDLYELWTFFAVKAALEAELGGWSWEAAGLERLLSVTDTGEGACWRASDGHRALSISFNQSFASYFSRNGRPRWSLSGARRPDLVLSLAGAGAEGRWLCLDAKYRAGRQRLADAFASVHLYRDALRYDGFGGQAQGGFLLAPAESPDAAAWFSPAFRASWGMGIWALTPGQPPPDGFAAELLGLLGA